MCVAPNDWFQKESKSNRESMIFYNGTIGYIVNYVTKPWLNQMVSIWFGLNQLHNKKFKLLMPVRVQSFIPEVNTRI